MEIILMRHAKPILSEDGWIAPAEMERWIEHYDLSEVEAEGIPVVSLTLASSAALIVASTASRALSSVQALGHTPYFARHRFLSPFGGSLACLHLSGVRFFACFGSSVIHVALPRFRPRKSAPRLLLTNLFLLLRMALSCSWGTA
jgi:hypothetical protein